MRQLLTILLLSLALTAGAQPRPRFNAECPAVHDPVMARGEDGRYYVFSTGMGISVMSSADLRTWRQEDPVFDFRNDEIPRWAMDSVRGYRGHTWAPDICRHKGLWYLYYSCSTFGKNRSAIGVATNKTLDPGADDYQWQDHGAVIVSRQHQDPWNAIDPNLVIDHETGAPYLAFGSFWDGIQLVRLSDDLLSPLTQPLTISRRTGRRVTLAEIDNPQHYTIEGSDTIEAGDNAVEAPFIAYNAATGYYYLFVSFDYCCRGQASTYKTVYGRSRSIEGPYLDKAGRPMTHGGGTCLFGPDDQFFGIGHCAVYPLETSSAATSAPQTPSSPQRWLFLSHAYDKARGGAARLFLRELAFDAEGWIVVVEGR